MYTVMTTATMNSVMLLNEFIRQGREHGMPLVKSGREHFKEIFQTSGRLEGEARGNSVAT